MSKKYEVADVLYEQITAAAKVLAEAPAYDIQTTGLEQLANAYAKVVEHDRRSATGSPGMTSI